MIETILISACLVGQKVRYDGRSSQSDGDLIRLWHSQGRLIPLCPEVAGGLSVPRPPAEIVGGDGADVLDGRAKLKTEAGVDVTDAFIAGAHHALAVAQKKGARIAILKSKSPSCGSSKIYDGTFTATRQAGMGVTAALLRRNGIHVFSEKELDQVAKELAG